jgi:hypothetical protein
MRLTIFTIVLVGLAACKQGAKQQPTATNDVPVVKLAPEDVVVLARGELQTGPRISGTLQAATR